MAGAIGACSDDTFSSGGDAGSPDVGTSEASSAGDAAVDGDAGSWCALNAPDARFCVDFDEAPTVGLGWSGVDKRADDQIALDPLAVSPPSSARVTLMPADASCRYARLQRHFSGSWSRVSVGYDVRLGAAENDAGFTSGFMVDVQATHGDGTTCSMLLFDGTVSSRIAAQLEGADGAVLSTTYERPLLLFPVVGRWSHVDIDIDWIAGTIRVRVDGNDALDPAVTAIPPGCQGPANLDVAFGPHCQTTATELRFDDIVIDGP